MPARLVQRFLVAGGEEPRTRLINAVDPARQRTVLVDRPSASATQSPLQPLALVAVATSSKLPLELRVGSGTVARVERGNEGENVGRASLSAHDARARAAAGRGRCRRSQAESGHEAARRVHRRVEQAAARVPRGDEAHRATSTSKRTMDARDTCDRHQEEQ